ncbi:MAG: PAS domain-containing protein [Alphaproteobacteria bacterium]|nr:PAS domain-containing protein [Alphaproteobacteria bacterium]
MNMELNIILTVAVFLIVALVMAIVVLQLRIYGYKRKIYFIRRDRERCNELLCTAKDGYFCFVYPDQKVKDPQKNIIEKCSRKLAVLLGLKSGTASSFAEVVNLFGKEDAILLKKYVNLLQQEGLAFEDVLSLKNGHRFFAVYGNRVQSNDNNLYCDIVWFRDISAQTEYLDILKQEQQNLQAKFMQLENMIDGIDSPLWLRDEQLNLLAINKKYAEYAGKKDKDEVLRENIELNNNKGEAVALLLAQSVQKSKKKQKKSFNIVIDGNVHNYDVYENPYFIGDELDKIGTVGYLVDNTELKKAKRNFKINQNNHLEILGVLGTAFAIFDEKTNLYFSNASFRNLWGLDSEFLEKTPTYMQFIETIRQHKLLPSIPDFKAFKDEELSVFGGLWKIREDLLHLPDGRTIHRFRMPHPNGVIFAYEDVSDRLATMRRLNDLTSMQQGILDNLSDAVIILGANQRLKFYNRAYLKLWGLDYDKVEDEPKLEAIISMQKLFFSNVDDWPTFKQIMLDNILAGHKFTLLRDDNMQINVSPQIFYDGSIMLTYTTK